MHLGIGQDRRGDGAGRVDDGLQMGVVVVEDVARHAVEERAVHDVEALGAAEKRRPAAVLRTAPGRRPRRPASRDATRRWRRRPSSGRCACLPAHGFGQVFEPRADDVARQGMRDPLASTGGFGAACSAACAVRPKDGAVSARPAAPISARRSIRDMACPSLLCRSLAVHRWDATVASGDIAWSTKFDIR